MATIALIHTVPSVYASFPGLVRETLGPDTAVLNTVDEYLASDPAEKGEFTKTNLNRLHALLRNAELTGPDAIVVTCSTLSPPVEMLRPFIAVPLVTIDGAMLRLAAEAGGHIAVMATARSAVGPVKEGLLREAAKLGKTPDLETIVLDDAYAAIKRLDKETHDRLVKEAASRFSGRDLIVLAQASMAHLEDEVGRISGVRTLSSPKLCMEELKKIVK